MDDAALSMIRVVLRAACVPLFLRLHCLVLDWIAPSENTSQHVTWKYCSCKVRAHYTDLIKHSETHKHWNAFAPGNQLCLKDTIAHRLPADMEQKRCALKISLFTACHMALNSVDEPSGILNGELRQDIALHRTKCTALITKVIAPHFAETLALAAESRFPFWLMKPPTYL